MLRYAITDRKRLGETDVERLPALVSLVERWAADGIDYIQIREKDLSAKALLTLSLAMGTAASCAMEDTTRHGRTLQPQLLINSRPDLAIAAGLSGVHLTAGQGVLNPGHIRRLYAVHSLEPPTISVSCHSLDEVRRAVENRANLILFGPVFGKSIAGHLVTPPIGLSALSAACKTADNIPVLALGGITVENTPACLQAGAKGIAGITLFCATE